MNNIEKIKEILPYTKQLNILFIEDNIEVKTQVEKLLNNFFNNIDLASNGEEGLEKYIEYEKKNSDYYDIVITDLSMPKMGGLELCEELVKINDNQVILVVSAYTNPENLCELINLGITKFIQKPINQDNLLEAILQAVDSCQNGNNRFQ